MAAGAQQRIKVGDKVPTNVKLWELTAEGKNASLTSGQLFEGKRVVVFGLPGAFTPTCSATHCPAYVASYPSFAKKGIDTVVCLSVNDAYVMEAWGRSLNGIGKLRFIGDGNGEFHKAVGLAVDKSGAGLGLRCACYAMVVDNCEVKYLGVEPAGEVTVSSAAAALAAI